VKPFKPPIPPWKPDETCPCGNSSLALKDCCLGVDGIIRLAVPELLPPGPVTGFGHPKCYLNPTNDCCTKISGEHVITRNVLTALSGKIEFFGLPWVSSGQAQLIGVDTLKSNILCRRHNSALSPLDSAAGNLFRALQTICEDISPRNKSLSRRGKWSLVSGEAIELWGLKTLFGLYHAKFVTEGNARATLPAGLDVNLLLSALRQRHVSHPCGLYLRAMSGQAILNVDEKISVTPLGSEDKRRLTGIRIGMNAFEFEIILDPTGVNFAALATEAVYHPWRLSFRNRLRHDNLVITWADTTNFGLTAEFTTEPVRAVARAAKRQAASPT